MARKSRIVNQVQVQLEQVAYRWRIAIYVRLSVEDGDDVELNSIGNQKKLCMAHLSSIQDGTLVNVYVDHGYTGMNYNRPGFQDMYDAIVRGDVNCVLVKDVSRFGRHYIITSEYLQRTFPNMGVRFISLNDDYDSLHPDADVEGLLLPFKMIMNDSYAKDISKKIRSSITAKMNAGDYLPSRSSIPFGYIRNPEANTFDVDTEVAPTIVRIYEMRAEGMPFNTIARILNEEGVPSPGKIRYMRGISKDKRFENAEWIRGTLRKILSDPVYLGSRVHGKVKRDRLGAEKTRRSEDEWQVHTDMHEAIISAELFYKVQAVNENEIAHRNTTYETRNRCENDMRDILRDKLYCGNCGRRMMGGKRNQRKTSNLPSTIYFQCNEYAYSNRTRCFNHYISQEKIVSTLMKVMESQVRIAADVEALLNAHAKTVSSRCAEAEVLQSIRVKRRNTEAKLERLLMDLTSGLIDKSEYEFTKSRYLQQVSELQESEAQAEKAVALVKEKMDEAQSWLDSIKAFRKVPKLTKELVDLFISKILIYESGYIHVELNYGNPFADFHLNDNRKETEIYGRDQIQLRLPASV